MFDFQKLDVYQKAKSFCKQITLELRSKSFDRVTNDQLRRASLIFHIHSFKNFELHNLHFLCFQLSWYNYQGYIYYFQNHDFVSNNFLPGHYVPQTLLPDNTPEKIQISQYHQEEFWVFY